MKPLPTLLCGLALLSTIAVAQAAAPAAPAPAPAAKPGDKTPPAPATILDAYIVEVTDKVQLTDSEKKDIQGIYTADGVALKKILNDDSLSAILKAGQVADLRDERNRKIEVILHDLDREKAFYEVEANYRVSLTEFAADGGLVPPGAAPDQPAPPPPPAPATANTPNVDAPPKKDAKIGATSASASPSKPAPTTPPNANTPVAEPTPATNAPAAAPTPPPPPQ